MNLRYSEYQRMQRRPSVWPGRVVALGLVVGAVYVADPKHPWVAKAHWVGNKSISFVAGQLKYAATNAENWANGKLTVPEQIHLEAPVSVEYEIPAYETLAAILNQPEPEAETEETETVMVMNFDADFEVEDQAPEPAEPEPIKKPEKPSKKSSKKTTKAEVLPKADVPELPVGDDGASERLFLVSNLLPEAKD